jgi:hypothetical protein
MERVVVYSKVCVARCTRGVGYIGQDWMAATSSRIG